MKNILIRLKFRSVRLKFGLFGENSVSSVKIRLVREKFAILLFSSNSVIFDSVRFGSIRFG